MHTDFRLHMKRRMLQFEVIHKCALLQPHFLFSTWEHVFPGAGFVYILGLVMSLTHEKCLVVLTSRLL